MNETIAAGFYCLGKGVVVVVVQLADNPNKAHGYVSLWFLDN